MSKDDYLPTNRLGRLKYSISTLWHKFGRVDNPILGLLINFTTALLGVVPFALGWGQVAQLIGAVWIILHIIPLLRKVIE